MSEGVEVVATIVLGAQHIRPGTVWLLIDVRLQPGYCGEIPEMFDYFVCLLCWCKKFQSIV